MRPLRAICLTSLTCALIAPPTAGAATRTYAGWLDGMTEHDDALVVTTTSKRTVRSMAVAWTAACTDGVPAAFHGRVPVGTGLDRLKTSRNRNGVLTATYDKVVDVGSSVFDITGRITGRLTKAKGSGTLRMNVTEISADNGTVLSTCATGTQRWTARRGAGRYYGGTSSQNEPVTMVLTSSRRMVWDLGIGWHGTCSSGGSIDVPDVVTEFPISGGRFGDAWQHRDDAGNVTAYELSGALSRTRALGSFTATRELPSGTTCSTGPLTYSLRSG